MLKVLGTFKVLCVKQVLDAIIKFIRNGIIASQMKTNLDNKENNLNEDKSEDSTEDSNVADSQEKSIFFKQKW